MMQSSDSSNWLTLMSRAPGAAVSRSHVLTPRKVAEAGQVQAAPSSHPALVSLLGISQGWPQEQELAWGSSLGSQAPGTALGPAPAGAGGSSYSSAFQFADSS